MKVFSYLAIFTVFFVICLPNLTFAQTDKYIEQKEVDISTSPHKIFYNLSNLKPGDKSIKVLTVFNLGKQDFEYIFTSRFLTGSEDFFNELILSIRDENRILYEGLLQDFEELEPRELESGNSEMLTFTIEIPYELGNEFQGLGSEFQFKLFVEGTLGGVLPVDNKLPTTGTEMFNLLATGTVIILAGLVLFAYVKRKKLDTKRP